MPTSTPLLNIPKQFQDVDQLLKDMPIIKADGSAGLLATGAFGAAAKKLKLHDVSAALKDNRLATALFRDYTFLASAYLLEPSHLGLLASGSAGIYGEGRDHIPEAIAVPLVKLAQHLDNIPLLDYAHAYALNNFYTVDPAKGLGDWRNLKTFRKFHGGADEEGFIIVHIAMGSHTNKQVSAALDALRGAALGDFVLLEKSLNSHAQFLDTILNIFDEMMVVSHYKGYLSFRTFIMGITGNTSIFPRGVIYEGVSKEPKFYRGETGAQDSIIPTTDSLLQMAYPKNLLVEYLMELRQYRPKDHRAYVDWIKKSADSVKLREVAFKNARCTFAIVKNLYQVQRMRSKHWQYTKSYIIDQTKHAKATGGTPITTWLPNNLGSTLEYLEEAMAHLHTLLDAGQTLEKADLAQFANIETDVSKKIAMLQKEVIRMQQDFKADEQIVDQFSKREKPKCPV